MVAIMGKTKEVYTMSNMIFSVFLLLIIIGQMFVNAYLLDKLEEVEQWHTKAERVRKRH